MNSIYVSYCPDQSAFYLCFVLRNLGQMIFFIDHLAGMIYCRCPDFLSERYNHDATAFWGRA